MYPIGEALIGWIPLKSSLMPWKSIFRRSYDYVFHILRPRGSPY